MSGNPVEPRRESPVNEMIYESGGTSFDHDLWIGPYNGFLFDVLKDLGIQVGRCNSHLSGRGALPDLARERAGEVVIVDDLPMRFRYRILHEQILFLVFIPHNKTTSPDVRASVATFFAEIRKMPPTCGD
ncbi:MAG: hypothetical protein HZA88_02065 [Verrucomicrobia bacterium]|nr:hypothetical protein [Verrucomicrobiota bacterium]